MKVKALAGALVISLLLNIAGIIFFVCFLKVQNDYKKLRRERDIMAQNLSVVRAAGNAEEALATQQFFKRTFISLLDGQEDFYAFQPPSMPDKSDNTLVVYLHGMGSNYLEPFTNPSTETIAQAIVHHYADVGILSCSYRKDASWGSDAAMSDITQNIREIEQQYPIKHIIIMGTSMGGCTALTYSTQAPADIKSRLEGIVCCEGAGSLQELSEQSAQPLVKMAIVNAMGGTFTQVPATYQRKSFLPNLAALPRSTKVAVISASADQIVPPKLQSEIVEALDKEHRPVKLITVDGGHGCPPAPIYLEALNFTRGKS